MRKTIATCILLALSQVIACSSAPEEEATGSDEAPLAAPGDLVNEAPRPEEKKFGCNYNTSCRANCEWCGVSSCRCVLKGIP